jgi:hypothetical protein
MPVCEHCAVMSQSALPIHTASQDVSQPKEGDAHPFSFARGAELNLHPRASAKTKHS